MLSKAFTHDVAAGVVATVLASWIGVWLGPETQRTTQAEEFRVTLPPATPATPPPPAQEREERQSNESEIHAEGQEIAKSYRRQCTLQGRSGAFDAVVFSASYNWQLGKTDRVQLNGQEVDLPSILREGAFQSVMDSAKEIIAVGAASCETPNFPGGGLLEERRALQRANQLIEWIERAHPPLGQNASVYPYIPLSLGRFEGPCESASTWNQRRIILVAVTARDEGLDFEECLRQGLFGHPQLSLLFRDYSKFELGGHVGTDLPVSLK